MVPAGISWQAQLSTAGLGLSCLSAQAGKQSTGQGTAWEMFCPAHPPPRCPSEELCCWGCADLPKDEASGDSGSAVLSPGSGGNSHSAQHHFGQGVLWPTEHNLALESCWKKRGTLSMWQLQRQ